MRPVLKIVVLMAMCVAVVLAGMYVKRRWGQPGPWRAEVDVASDEAELAIKTFLPAPGMQVRLFAAEPMLANPTNFTFDQRGRCYVAESHRQHTSLIDTRKHLDWLDTELALGSAEQRLAFYVRQFSPNLHMPPQRFLRDHNRDGQFDYHDLEVETERIRRIEDVDGDGKADRSTIFAEGFNSPINSVIGGVLARGGDVYVTCIPELWRLHDNDGDGKADVQQRLSYGYGVHMGFPGHDVHGLRVGPDGRLYFSMGDRGLHVRQGDRTLDYPHTGSVLRCDLDGSNLQVVASGLRNPQELAFDEYGNLFTGDNNGDRGDKARLVYIVEGGDSGWRTGYQYMDNAGPWNKEKLWYLPFQGQAAYVLPPVAHIAAGPCGFTHYPGTGLPAQYKGHFFLSDFSGTPRGSGVHSFAVTPKGAAFEVVDHEKLIWSILTTDVTFGPGGGVYLLDWVIGYAKTGRGRVYHLFEPASADEPIVAETARLLAEGMAQRPMAELAKLLAHADMRVRQEAQFALADHGLDAIATLAPIAAGSESLFARLHAIWGLGQIARRLETDSDRDLALAPVAALLGDGDEHVRDAAVRVVGDERYGPAFDRLLALLGDADLHVRMHAAMSLGKLGRRQAIQPIIDVLRDNADRDAYLRHAGVMAMVWINDLDALLAAAADPSPAVRMAVLLALRRLARPEVARFLDDPQPRLVVEAARAIHDVPINAAMAALARLDRPGLNDPALLRRIHNANYRLGGAEQAQHLASLATRASYPAAMRAEALTALGDWANPSGRDRVVNLWRPLPPRSDRAAVEALRPVIAQIIAGVSEPVSAPVSSGGATGPVTVVAPDAAQIVAAEVAAKLHLTGTGPALLALLAEPSAPVATRVAAIDALAALNDPHVPEALELARQAGQVPLRIEAMRLAARLEPPSAEAVAELAKTIRDGQVPEKQAALAALSGMAHEAADEVLGHWMDELIAGQAPPAIQLDILTAAEFRQSPAIKAKLARYEEVRPKYYGLAEYGELMEGGDAEAGRHIFLEKTETACIRCHRVNGQGGEAGPDLSNVGGRRKRSYILKSVLYPSLHITAGYQNVVLYMKDGETIVGVVKQEDQRHVVVSTTDQGLRDLPLNQIASRQNSPSAMPDWLSTFLTRGELRDLVEFLSTLKTGQGESRAQK